MDILNFSGNLVRLRREKCITQSKLADFIGVTKASVSKWETGQSLPDVLILPQLAAYFDVTIDELLGYEPRLSREQTDRLYHELAADFAEKPFAEVLARSRALVKQYYACFPFLSRIACLWLNHYMLAEPPQQQEILEDISALSDHIMENCGDTALAGDALMIKSVACLGLGRADQVIGPLEEVLDPFRLAGQNNGILLSAYQMTGQLQKAQNYAQISMYTHLLALLSDAVQMLSLESSDLPLCEEIIRRTDCICQAFDLFSLHTNLLAQLEYQAAYVFAVHGEKDRALERLRRYMDCALWLMDEDHARLHGDSFFDAIESYFEEADIDTLAPRDVRFIPESVFSSLQNPAFEGLQDDPDFQAVSTAFKLKMKGE